MDENKNEVTIQLDYPFTLGDRTVESITMRRPTMDDIIKARVKDFSDHAQLCALVARISDLGLPELAKVDYFADFGRIADAIAAFSPSKS